MDSSVPLPADLITKVESKAQACGMSIADFVRVSLEKAIAQEPSTDRNVFRDEGPNDLAANHDSYLYGESS